MTVEDERQKGGLNADERIAASLERLAYVLGVLERDATRAHTLSTMQVRLLAYLHTLSDALCRVSQVARDFALTQATVSESVSALETRGLVSRSPLPEDRRVHVLQLTDRGRALAERLPTGTLIMRPHLQAFSTDEKEQLAGLLTKLIRELHEGGVITISRMCVTCGFYREDGTPGGVRQRYCTLLEQTLAPDELRVDCPEYKAG